MLHDSFPSIKSRSRATQEGLEVSLREVGRINFLGYSRGTAVGQGLDEFLLL